MDPVLEKAEWLKQMESGDIRPYVFVRPENRIQNPGTRHRLDWFPNEPIYKDPLDLGQLEFAEQIYDLEHKAFGPSNLQIPRWVFYDCAVMPGFVAGFAMKSSKLPDAVKKVLRHDPKFDWTPLSLFIIIPTMKKGEWVAHNLCAVNSILPEQDRFYGLGFLSKAFGLWYANVETCCGMTQWGSPALKLHSHFGHLQILTSYTPVHTHAETITYRSEVNIECWEKFFTREPDLAFLEKYEPSGIVLDPTAKDSQIALQQKIQNGEGPFYLNAAQIAEQKLTEPLSVYRMKGNHG
ncbi:MAG: hypothetical protein KF767_16985 [Bdellovibrionaceae bacterium]|nr:hypothetical protein [Pseudobdellovibrionaceae bacterium]